MCVHSWTLSPQMSLYLEIASKKHLTPIAALSVLPAGQLELTSLCACASKAQCSKCLALRCLSLAHCNFRPGFRGVHHFTSCCRGSSHTFCHTMSGIKPAGQQPPTHCCSDGGHLPYHLPKKTSFDDLQWRSECRMTVKGVIALAPGLDVH